MDKFEKVIKKKIAQQFNALNERELEGLYEYYLDNETCAECYDGNYLCLECFFELKEYVEKKKDILR